MSWIEWPLGQEKELILNASSLNKIEENFWDLWYEEFIEWFRNIDNEQQQKVLKIFDSNASDSNFINYVEDEWPIVDSESITEDFITKFESKDIAGINLAQQESRKFSEAKEKIKQNELLDTQEDELDTELADRIQEKEVLEWKALELLWLDLSTNDKYKKILEGNLDNSVDWRIKFLNDNYSQLLDAAKEWSHTELVRLHKQFSKLKKQGVLELPNFEEYDISLSESILDSESILSPSDEQPIQAALWGSKIQSISWDGKIVKWTWWEVIDNSGVVTQLSLEWKDGMILEVWEVEKLDTRNQEVQISKLSKEKQDNERKMGANEKAIWGLEKAHSEFRSMPDEAYTNDTFRERIAKKFSSQSPKWEAMQIFRAAESSSWVELKNMVLLFLAKKIVQLSNDNVELSQRNSEITRDIGIFQAQIDSKRRLAAEKIYNKKEKVRQSQQFLEWLGVSRVIANASEIFAMIRPDNPVPLPNGDIITGVDFSTMSFEGSFTPSLWNSGTSDMRTQEVLVQLMNKSLSAWFDWPMRLTWNGYIIYEIQGEIRDKVIFEEFVNKLSGAGNVEMLIQGNLFDSNPWLSTKGNPSMK